ncbi:MAG: FHA domain-containing protein [Deltaproteobacteria bacterium]|nr:FHA domain-containing protein [Deltaproteobacteria bacterium]
MQEIEIAVLIDKKKQATYRFSEFPLEIGRDASCHFIIRHKVIGRKLCKVWWEPDGIIHLEEHSGLTNPIYVNGTLVEGGIAATSLSARIGPVGLEIRKATRNPTGTAQTRPSWAGISLPVRVAVGALTLLLAAIWIWTAPSRPSSGVSMADFPLKLTFTTVDAVSPDAEQAAYAVRMAETEYSRMPEDIQRRKSAIEQMDKAAHLPLPNSPLSARARVISKKWKSELNAAYRLELVTLFHAIDNDDVKQIQKSAPKLIQYLDTSEKGLILWLQRQSNIGEEQ